MDVLFETAAAAHGPALAGILLTGAGSDGSLGLKCFQEGGGITIVQDPRNAECDAMSRGALREVTPDYLISLAELPELMIRLTCPYPPMTPPAENHAE